MNYYCANCGEIVIDIRTVEDPYAISDEKQNKDKLLFCNQFCLINYKIKNNIDE